MCDVCPNQHVCLRAPVEGSDAGAFSLCVRVCGWLCGCVDVVCVRNQMLFAYATVRRGQRHWNATLGAGTE